MIMESYMYHPLEEFITEVNFQPRDGHQWIEIRLPRVSADGHLSNTMCLSKIVQGSQSGSEILSEGVLDEQEIAAWVGHLNLTFLAALY
jgi:hypothetical protein